MIRYFCDRCGDRTNGREASVTLGESDGPDGGVPLVERVLCRSCAARVREAIGPVVVQEKD